MEEGSSDMQYDVKCDKETDSSKVFKENILEDNADVKKVEECCETSMNNENSSKGNTLEESDAQSKDTDKIEDKNKELKVFENESKEELETTQNKELELSKIEQEDRKSAKITDSKMKNPAMEKSLESKDEFPTLENDSSIDKSIVGKALEKNDLEKHVPKFGISEALKENNSSKMENTVIVEKSLEIESKNEFPVLESNSSIDKSILEKALEKNDLEEPVLKFGISEALKENNLSKMENAVIIEKSLESKDEFPNLESNSLDKSILEKALEKSDSEPVLKFSILEALKENNSEKPLARADIEKNLDKIHSEKLLAKDGKNTVEKSGIKEAIGGKDIGESGDDSLADAVENKLPDDVVSRELTINSGDKVEDKEDTKYECTANKTIANDPVGSVSKMVKNSNSEKGHESCISDSVDEFELLDEASGDKCDASPEPSKSNKKDDNEILDSSEFEHKDVQINKKSENSGESIVSTNISTCDTTENIVSKIDIPKEDAESKTKDSKNTPLSIKMTKMKSNKSVSEIKMSKNTEIVTEHSQSDEGNQLKEMEVSMDTSVTTASINENKVMKRKHEDTVPDKEGDRREKKSKSIDNGIKNNAANIKIEGGKQMMDIDEVPGKALVSSNAKSQQQQKNISKIDKQNQNTVEKDEKHENNSTKSEIFGNVQKPKKRTANSEESVSVENDPKKAKLASNVEEATQTMEHVIDVVPGGSKDIEINSKKNSGEANEATLESKLQKSTISPVRQYLNQFVPFLLEGLMKLAYVRPGDPIQYLADWMLDNKKEAYRKIKVNAK